MGQNPCNLAPAAIKLLPSHSKQHRVDVRTGLDNCLPKQDFAKGLCICSWAASAALLSAETFFAASVAFFPAASAAAFFAAPATLFSAASSAFAVFSIVVAMILKQRVVLKMRKETIAPNRMATTRRFTRKPISLPLLAHTQNCLKQPDAGLKRSFHILRHQARPLHPQTPPNPPSSPSAKRSKPMAATLSLLAHTQKFEIHRSPSPALPSPLRHILAGPLCTHTRTDLFVLHFKLTILNFFCQITWVDLEYQ
ncbi:hypothetical protein L596_019400 [Steinernema carpocapsae]|uniref:Uncharacterized protein n=1 Tax=Steinernema carpocapsae TaxID=34508 RepID=A0A4U5MQE5_STECR|nr:hypothetical protein L596_019400 [Steinernema carpocapsae]